MGVLGRFSSDPCVEHYNGAKRVLRYLRKTATSTIELCLGIQGNGQSFTIYADADFAGDPVEMRSTSGMVIRDRYGATVAWKSTKQPVTAKSTADAEFIATAMAMEWMWLGKLENEYHGNKEYRTIPVYNDNEACIANVNRGDYQPPSRHVGVRYYWIRDMVRLGEATVSYMPSTQMPADGLTKGLDRVKHEIFIGFIGLKLPM